MTTSGEIRLALDDAALNAVPFVPTPPQYSILVLKFNSANGAFNGVQALLHGQGGLPDFNNLANTLVTNTVPGVGLEGPAGLALVDDATKLVVTGWAADAQQQLWVPVIGEYDLSGNVWADLLPTLNIQGNLPDFVCSRLYRNVSPTGTPDGLYLPLAGALGCITGVDDGTYAFTNPVGTQATVTPPVFSSGGGSLSVPYFINAQITHDPSVALYNAPACCATRSAIEGYAGYTFPNVPGTYTWTATDNPFGNCPEVLFLEDLIIPAGVHLNIDGMHLKFAPTAHMILRAGAYVDADHSAFTPEDCLGVRWQGIRVEGVPTNLTQNGTVQGQLWLDDCLVEEAHVGIWCGREGANRSSPRSVTSMRSVLPRDDEVGGDPRDARGPTSSRARPARRPSGPRSGRRRGRGRARGSAGGRACSRSSPTQIRRRPRPRVAGTSPPSRARIAS